MVTNYVTQAAQDMPEDKYAYRPTPEVRSFGELIGHVAGAQNMICAAALGEPQPAEDAVEKAAKTKEALIQALRQSTEYCNRAFSQADAATRAPTTLFGRETTRFHALVLNATHNGEHYGNLVTYLRINGIVPPSSRQGM
ncbi:MAG TPA: DinB family protein [Gemmatimonadales bacterium]|nr:DinB family protein [Gemmatimonadales bacterium]